MGLSILSVQTISVIALHGLTRKAFRAMLFRNARDGMLG
jgi:hypothetical protein